MNWIWPQCFLRNFDFRPYRSFWPKGPKQNSSSKLTKYLFSPKWNFEIGFARKTRFSSTFHGLRWPRLTERSASHPEAAPDSCFEPLRSSDKPVLASYPEAALHRCSKPLRSSGMPLLVATLEQHQSAASSHFDKPLLATLKQHHTACIEPNRSSTTQLLRATSKQRQTSACYSEAALHRCYEPRRSSGTPLLATLQQHHSAASRHFDAVANHC